MLTASFQCLKTRIKKKERGGKNKKKKEKKNNLEGYTESCHEVMWILSDGRSLRIYFLVIADDAIQMETRRTLVEWQKEAHAQSPAERKGSGITTPGQRINNGGVRWDDSGCSVWSEWRHESDAVLKKCHSLMLLQFQRSWSDCVDSTVSFSLPPHSFPIKNKEINE